MMWGGCVVKRKREINLASSSSSSMLSVKESPVQQKEGKEKENGGISGENMFCA
jgi:hypothetical protein